MDDTRQPSQPGPDPAESAPSLGLSPRETEQASLKSLRDHVAKAVEEIVRLRAQNRSLVRRLAESEASGGISTGVFDEGTDIHELKAKISSFITSIDSYLAETDDV